LAIWGWWSAYDAERPYDIFVSSYQDKDPKRVETLRKDHDELLAFYDFPAKHWPHSRTTNPIDLSFATVRHRTRNANNCLSRKTALAMV
jgi:putative transposase